MTNKEIAKDIVIALINRISFPSKDVSANISADQAIDMSGEAVAKLYRRIYEEVAKS